MEDKKAKFKRLPLLEVIILGFLVVAPLFLGDFYTVILTRMLILCLLAISFELCWGYSGIMTFGQGLFFGMAGYAVALLANKVGFVQIWGVIPIGIFVGTVVSFLLAWLLLLGKKAPEIIFVALGTLTFSYAAERLVSGWYYVGGGNGLSIFEFLSKDVDLRLCTNIGSMARKNNNWILGPLPDQNISRFDWVILAIPPTQAIHLLPSELKWLEILSNLTMLPCVSLMASIKFRCTKP